MIWTEEAVDRLRDEMASPDYVSARTVGKKIGCSRNAVIGKCHRLGILIPNDRKKSAPQHRPKGMREPWSPPKRVNQSTYVSLTQARSTIQSRRRRSDGPSPAVRSVVDALIVGCQWPIGDPHDRDFRFCGKPTTKACYCSRHAAMAYETIEERRARRDEWTK